MEESNRSKNLKQWVSFGLISLLIVLGWNTMFLYPLKVLVVFFHELSHGLAAILTGGSIVEIEVVKEQGGHCITRGGSRFITLTAGYLGSLFWGGIILVGAARTRHDKTIMTMLGGVLLLATVLYVRPFVSFGFIFGFVIGTTMILAGKFLPEKVNDLALRIIGLTSCMYAILDIKSDIIDRVHLRSDARMLSEITGIPTLLWGLIWIVVAIVASFLFLRFAAQDAPES